MFNRYTRKEKVMFRRAITIGLLGVSLVAALESEAHLAGYKFVNGKWVHVTSLLFKRDIQGVPNLEQKPAGFRCTATLTKVQVICLGIIVERPEPLKDPPVLTTHDQIQSEDLVFVGKKMQEKIAHVECDFPDEDLLFALSGRSDICADEDPIDVLVTKLTGGFEVFECTGLDPANPCSAEVQTYREKQDCDLPGEFDIVKNFPPPGETPYKCSVEMDHVK